MDTVFITHSRHDAPILDHINELIKIANIEPIFYSYDVRYIASPWKEICEKIRRSRALFVVLSNNLSSSSYTQNWVGLEVGVACALNKPVLVFEELYHNYDKPFPIPYLTAYVPYELSNPRMCELITSVAQGYRVDKQTVSIMGGGALGGLIFSWPGLIVGAIIGSLVGTPQSPPYFDLLCYHLDCKIRFKTYVWQNEFECPACRRMLRYTITDYDDGSSVIYPAPYPEDLNPEYDSYIWYDSDGVLRLFGINPNPPYFR